MEHKKKKRLSALSSTTLLSQIVYKSQVLRGGASKKATLHNSFTKSKDKLLKEKKEGKKRILHESFIRNFVSKRRKKKKGKRNMGKVGPFPQLGHRQMKELSSLTGTPREKRV